MQIFWIIINYKLTDFHIYFPDLESSVKYHTSPTSYPIHTSNTKYYCAM